MNSSEQTKNCAFDVAGSRSDDRLDLLRVIVGAIAEPMFRGFFCVSYSRGRAVDAPGDGFTAISGLLLQDAVLFGLTLSASQIYTQANLLNLTDLKSR